ncbi:hypothetical protein RPHASCH2410_CH10585 [Rhizobium phaseoli Ch24-10]|nr:hypothetical protein RPHASCH2410_CH10585 [Rhizobium phaseoli Ch24-10]
MRSRTAMSRSKAARLLQVRARVRGSARATAPGWRLWRRLRASNIAGRPSCCQALPG